MSAKLAIGIAATEAKYENYPAWMLEGRGDIEIVELSASFQNQDILKKCSGLILSGGVDVDPFFYDGPIAYPNQPTAWKRERDLFEMDLLKTALAVSMPVLGICRGLQLVNVTLGGTLVQDIEATGKQNHRAMDGVDFYHPVSLQNDTLLAKITQVSSGIVNSAHHQAIDKVAPLLQINARAEEDIIEGLEWSDPANRSPLLCVQW
ncbi:MAG: gamma-glutamyl-gamma-aminobutyrate hydrolase family protein, partial [Bacteroidota bacterium]|nr:gamma-glutamyl-gamma-aminobutyrate hydrolase family protein [Bacteroidota bacterium]